MFENVIYLIFTKIHNGTKNAKKCINTITVNRVIDIQI